MIPDEGSITQMHVNTLSKEEKRTALDTFNRSVCQSTRHNSGRGSKGFSAGLKHPLTTKVQRMTKNMSFIDQQAPQAYEEMKVNATYMTDESRSDHNESISGSISLANPKITFRKHCQSVL